MSGFTAIFSLQFEFKLNDFYFWVKTSTEIFEEKKKLKLSIYIITSLPKLIYLIALNFKVINRVFFSKEIKLKNYFLKETITFIDPWSQYPNIILIFFIFQLKLYYNYKSKSCGVYTYSRDLRQFWTQDFLLF